MSETVFCVVFSLLRLLYSGTESKRHVAKKDQTLVLFVSVWDLDMQRKEQFVGREVLMKRQKTRVQNCMFPYPCLFSIFSVKVMTIIIGASEIQSHIGRVFQKYVYTCSIVKMRINIRSFGLFWFNLGWG